jgi:hypothetical protein
MIDIKTIHNLIDIANNKIVEFGYEILFKDTSRLEKLISLINEALEKGDLEYLRSIEFQFLILLEKGHIRGLKYNTFVDFGLRLYNNGEKVMLNFISPRIADIFNSRSVHKLNIFVTFTRKIRKSFLEQLLIENNFDYSRPVRSRLNLEIELNRVEVLKYLI